MTCVNKFDQQTNRITTTSTNKGEKNVVVDVNDVIAVYLAALFVIVVVVGGGGGGGQSVDGCCGVDAVVVAVVLIW